MMLRKTIALLITLSATIGCSAAPDRGRLSRGEEILEQAIRELDPSLETRYFSAYLDLNGDNRKEAVVYLVGPGACGSSGCHTVVFSPEKGRNGYRLVSSIGLTRLPIIAAKSRTHEWRDLVVFVAGGGILEGYNVVLPFNGTSYPESPFRDQAHPLEGKARGEILIQRRPYDEARPLRATGDDDQKREVDPEAANPGLPTDSQRAEPSLVFEHEAECGSPVIESMAWSILNGTAVRVTGGDEFILRTSTGEEIRVGLVAVDTSHHEAHARDLLSALIQDQVVTVLVNPSAAGKRSVVGVVQVGTMDVGRELLRAGVARFKEPPPYSVSTYTSCLYKITGREATGALGDNAPRS